MLFRDFSRDLMVRARNDAPQRPRVSVILPTYARAHGPLQRAIDSVLSQDYGNFELIVIDDGSRDGSAEVLRDYQCADPRVVIHSYRSNSGLPGLRVNQAALLAKGDLIAYQFDDDLWLEGSLSRRVEELEKAEDLAVVYSNALLHMTQPNGEVTERVLGAPFNFGLLRRGNYIANNTVMHHRRLFDLVGMYDPHISMRRFCDYDLLLRFASVANFIWIDASLSQVHANLDDSLGKDVPFYYDRYIKLITTRRNLALRPCSIADYDILRLDGARAGLSQDDALDYYRDEAVPFLAKFNDYCDTTVLYTVGAAACLPVNLYVVKPDFSTSVDVTIGNFARVDGFNAINYAFSPEVNLDSLHPTQIDTVVLYRTIAPKTTTWLNRTNRQPPAVYLMDDNMLHFHEVGIEHAFLSPGTLVHDNIVQQIVGADACVGYGDVIAADMRELNHRTMQLQTNIPRQYVQPAHHERGEKVRFAVLSGPVRNGVLAEIWPAIAAFARDYREQVEFHFWGVDPVDFGGLECEVHFKPFTHHYERYLGALTGSAFDVFLVPLDDTTRAAQSKSPVKLLEGVAAGAVSIFTNAQPYRDIPNDCCIKVDNNYDQWYGAMVRMVDIGEQGRSSMLGAAQRLVEAQYTTEACFYGFMATMKSGRLHQQMGTRGLLYAFHETALGGATLHLLQHAKFFASLGFRVVALAPAAPQWQEDFCARWLAATGNQDVVIDKWPSSYSDGEYQRQPSEEMMRVAAALAGRLRSYEIGMLHFATWSPTMSLLSAYLKVPAVASVHQYYPGGEGFAPGFADAIHCSSATHGLTWSQAARSRVTPIVCPVEDQYFALGRQRQAVSAGTVPPFRILVSGTLQTRKNQFEAIRALAILRKQGVDAVLDLIGYVEFRPHYVEQCRALAVEERVESYVFFHGFVADPCPFYAQADILMVCATDESMPQTILQAMASRVAVISTRVGGVTELVRHRYSGFIAQAPAGEHLAVAVMAYIALSAAQQQELLDRAFRTISLIARESYVKMKLVDLYWDAHTEFQRHFGDLLRASAIGQIAASEPELAGFSALRWECMASHPPPSLVPEPTEVVALASTAAEPAMEATILDEVFNAFLPRSFGLEEATFEPDAKWRDMLSSRRGWISRAYGSRLTLSTNLREVSYVEYALPCMRSPLNRLTVALFAPFSSNEGHVGIEIVTPKLGVVAHEVVGLQGLRRCHSLTVAFREPVVLTDDWLLRVFVRGSSVPIAVVERYDFSLFRWKRLRLPLVMTD